MGISLAQEIPLLEIYLDNVIKQVSKDIGELYHNIVTVKKMETT